MKTELVNLSQIELNAANPRTIKNDKFEKLINSLLALPKMLDLRPIVVDNTMVALGGNMRYRALSAIADMSEDELKDRLSGIRDFQKKTQAEQDNLVEYWLRWKDKPTAPVIKASELTDAEQREFIIKDNVGFGEWDMDALANEWDDLPLSDWGIDINWPEKNIEISSASGGEAGEGGKSEGEEDDSFFQSMLTDCIYESNNEFEIPNLLPDRQAGKLELPFAPWGADSRLRKDVSTYHFYVEDYRFEAIWKDPIKVLSSGAKAVVEPNLSLFDTTPVAYGLTQIYKKRWISRYFQECRIRIYVDLNVAQKFYGYNRLGIPDGWDAFATRGYNDRLEYLKAELQIAKEISGKDVPNLIVYGGGAGIRDFCIKNSLVYVEQFMQNK